MRPTARERTAPDPVRYVDTASHLGEAIDGTGILASTGFVLRSR